MGSKYSSELKQTPNHGHGGASTSFSKAEKENNGIENVSIFHLFNCWRCICFRPRHFGTVRSRPLTDALNNNNNIQTSDEIKFKKGNDNHAMQLKSSDGICCEKRWNEQMSENCQVEIYQNNQNVVLAESVCEKSKRQNSFKQNIPDGKKQLILNQKNLNKRSMSLKSCRAVYGHSIPNNNIATQSNNASSDLKKNFLSRLMSLSVDGKHRLGYVKQVDEPSNFRNHEVDDADEDKNERDELLDDERFFSERHLDFLRPVDSMEYFDSSPSTEDRFTDACLRFQNRNENFSTDLYEESCLENLESFCDKSVLLASMDTIDLGSSIESLLPGSQDNVAFKESPCKDQEGYILMDLETYKSLVDELEACKEILGQLESLLSNAHLH